jgi:hypothetical protein
VAEGTYFFVRYFFVVEIYADLLDGAYLLMTQAIAFAKPI